MAIIKEAVSVFWGVILETGKRYSQTVSRSFHISMAALESKSMDGGGDDVKTTSVMIHHGNTDYLICNLSQKLHCQQTLDLNFAEGEEIVLYLVGDGTVHLSGYLLADELDEPVGMDTTEFDSEEEGVSYDDTEMSTTFGDLETDGSSDDDDEDWEESFKKEKAKRRKLSSTNDTTGDSWTTDDYLMEEEDDDDDDEDEDDESEDVSLEKTPKIFPSKKTNKNKVKQEIPVNNSKNPEVNKSKNASPKVQSKDSPKDDKSNQNIKVQGSGKKRNKKNRRPQSAPPQVKGENNLKSPDTSKKNDGETTSAKKRHRKNKNKALNVTKSP